MTDLTIGLACVCLPAAVWRIHTVGLAEIYRRVARELLARAEARDAYAAALEGGRRYIGIELNAEYVKITRERAEKYMPLLISGL